MSAYSYSGQGIISTLICIVCLLTILCSVLPQTSTAAFLYLDPVEATLSRGDTITVAVRIDTDESRGECINTVDAVIRYDQGIRAIDVSRGNSILSLWLEQPTINENDRTIRFAGGLPGGYCGRIAGDPNLTNVIAEIVFRAPGFTVGARGDTTTTVWFDDVTQVLLHDGLGTRAPLRTQTSTITLRDTAGPVTDDSWRERVSDDTIPPADFTISLSRDEYAFSGKYFISFNTQDKQSGIDHYEVMEEPIEYLYAFKWGGADAPWVRAESPYVLKDQSLNSTIRVKAIDKAGNETIAVLVPDEAMRTRAPGSVMFWSAAALITIVAISVSALLLWRRKKQLAKLYDAQGIE